MLVREVTDLRRHERMLLYKDATIREIHHRVKNNLQTVASLLRLQSRRMTSEEAAEALQESVRRISSIALVHETLSQDSRQRVSFDKVAQRLIDMVAVGLTDPTKPVEMELRGSAGELPAEVATPWPWCCPNCSRTRSSTPSSRRVARSPCTSNAAPEPPPRGRDDGIGLPTVSGRSRTDANLGLRIAAPWSSPNSEGRSRSTPPRSGRGTTCEAMLPPRGATGRPKEGSRRLTDARTPPPGGRRHLAVKRGFSWPGGDDAGGHA
jgi:two-component system, sensor histidine kinase PdtaS